MKRIWVVGLVLLVASGLAFFVQADPETRPGYGWRHGGQGMGGYGMMGPGMSGLGMMGLGMMGPVMMPFWDDLSKEQQQRILDLQTAMMNAMGAKMADVHKKMLALREASLAYPLDQQAVMAKWKVLNEARGEIFQLRLAMVTQVQGIVGKERWEEMHRQRRGYGGYRSRHWDND